jgi:hypothetical protein
VSTIREVGWVARADLLERLRRSSTLAVLAFTLLAAWMIHTGALGVEVGGWRGVHDSAWIGMMMTVVVTTVLGLLGFYLVKDPITRDRRTGVGQILAATPTSNAAYLLGKWLSSTGVLLALLTVLGVAALAIQIAHGEAAVQPLRLVLPLVVVAGPALALVAAAALLFESIPVLRGGAGNVLWFFLFIASLWTGIEVLGPVAPGFDPFGCGIFVPSLRAAVASLDPGYEGGFVIGSAGLGGPLRVFTWPGIHWTAGLLASRMALAVAAAGIALLPCLWFDRFAAHAAPERRRSPRWDAPGKWVAQLTDRLGLVGAELRMVLAGQPSWWLLVLVGAALAGIWQPDALLLGWIWPLVAWSALGCRAERDGTLPLLLSTPGGVLRPVVAAWGAGAVLAAFAGLGTLARSTLDPVAAVAFAAGCAFIPALALACGSWTRSPRLFEVVWLLVWYVGLVNRAPGLDVVRTRSPLVISAWFASAAALLALAVAGRARARRSGWSG